MTASKNLLTGAVTLILAALFAAPYAAAQCSVFSLNYGGRPWPGGSIGVFAGEGISAGEIEDAIEIWERGCDALYAAGRIPRLLANRPGDRSVRIELDAKVSPREGVCGVFNAATIKVWGFAQRHGKVKSCGPVARLIAHELGHVLGLGDAPPDRQCCNHIMSPIWPDKLLIDRALPGECAIVAAANAPGLGLPGRTTEVIAADLTGDLQPAAAVEPTGTDAGSDETIVARAQETPVRAADAGSRLARFLDQRRAAQRGWLASRSIP